MGKTVRCANCGFLAFRNFNTSELEPAGRDTRESGTLETIPEFVRDIGITLPVKRHFPEPVCFVGAHDLFHEFDEKCPAGSSHEQETEARKQIFHTDRHCVASVKWKPGFTPKEHAQMMFDLDRDARIFTVFSLVIALLSTALLAYSTIKVTEPKPPLPIKIEMTYPSAPATTNHSSDQATQKQN